MMIWCDGAVINGSQFCGAGIVIQWNGDQQEYESTAVLAGRYRSAHWAEMIATERALEIFVIKLTVSPISIKIHSDSRHTLQQLHMGPLIRTTALAVIYWKWLYLSLQRIPRMWYVWFGSAGHAGIERHKVANSMAKQETLSDQSDVSINLKSAITRLRQFSLQWSHGVETSTRKHKTIQAVVLPGMRDVAMIRLPRNIPRQAHRAVHQLRVNRLTTTASYQALIGRCASPICQHWSGGGDGRISASVMPKLGGRASAWLWRIHWYHRYVRRLCQSDWLPHLIRASTPSYRHCLRSSLWQHQQEEDEAILADHMTELCGWPAAGIAHCVVISWVNHCLCSCSCY